MDKDNTQYCSIDGILYNKSRATLLAYPHGASLDVKIKKGTRIIGEDAFSEIPITSITFEEGLYAIENGAFYGSKFTSISLPSSIRIIHNSAFYCSSLEAINVSEQNPVFCSVDGVVYDKNKTKIYYWPDGKKEEMPEFQDTPRDLPVQPINEKNNQAFVYSDDTKNDYQGQSTVCIMKDATFNISWNSKFDSVKKITFADDVEILPSDIFFQFPNVEVIELPDRLEDISRAFAPHIISSDNENRIYGLKKLKSIEIDDSNPYYAVKDGVLYSKDMSYLEHYPSAKEDKVYEIPEFVTEMDQYAFNNPYLEEIKIGMRCSNYTWYYLSKYSILPNLKRYSVAKDNYYFSEIDGVLFDYDQTELIAYPVGMTTDIYMIPCTVIRLSEYCFRDATIGTLILPSDLEEISTWFSPFENSHIAAVEITDNDLYETQDGVLYTKGKKSLFYWPSDKKVTELTLPSTIRTLRLNEIPCISEVTQLTIPRDTTEIYIADLDSLSQIEVEEGNENFVLYDGFLYNSKYSSLELYPPNTKQTSLTIPNLSGWCHMDNPVNVPSIRTVVLEGSVADFPFCIFPNLEHIKLGKENTSFKVVDDVLYSDSMSELIWYPQNKKDSKFIIPSSVSMMGDDVLRQQNHLQSITLSKRLQYYEDMEWFADCKKLKEIKVAIGNKDFLAVNGVLFTKDLKTLLCYPTGKTAKSYTLPNDTEVLIIMTGNKYLTHLKLSRNLKGIVQENDASFKNLKKITVPASNKDFIWQDSVLYQKLDENLLGLELYPMGNTNESFTIQENVSYISEIVG